MIATIFCFLELKTRLPHVKSTCFGILLCYFALLIGAR